jgi:Cu/Ag efflux pump CusA
VTAAQDQIRRVLGQVPGAVLTSISFLTERIGETLSGDGASIVVNVFGNNLGELDRQAAQIARMLAGIAGPTEGQLESPLVCLRSLYGYARIGLPVGVPILWLCWMSYGTEVVGQTYGGNRVFNVSVLLASNRRSQVSEIGALPLRSPDENFVSLGQLADIQHPRVATSFCMTALGGYRR